jgi:hypothetical protein
MADADRWVPNTCRIVLFSLRRVRFRISALIASMIAIAGSSTMATAADLLLGKWIRIANNVDNVPDATLDFRMDGTVSFVFKKEPPVTWRFRREPLQDWLKRRKNDLDSCTHPGVEVITFADLHSGPFRDSGGWVLQLIPEHRILVNPLTQAWCRPGEEDRARKLLGLG